MKIIVDAMAETTRRWKSSGARWTPTRNHGVEIILVGRTAEVLKAVEACGQKSLPAGVEIKDAKEVVEIADDPAMAFKQKPDSSLTVGLNLLKDGAGDAFVSAGVHRGAALRGHAGGQAHSGHPPGRHGAPDSHRRGTGGPLRLRRQRRVHAGSTCSSLRTWAATTPSGSWASKSPGWAF